MEILVLNCGSSSVKFALWSAEPLRRLRWGIVERIGLANSRLLVNDAGGEGSNEAVDCSDHRRAVELVLAGIAGRRNHDAGAIAAVGHRVVHGGERFARSARIDEQLLREVERCSELAPLHNPPNLAGIRAARELLPRAVQVAVFDTAFHQSMPPEAYRYPLPAGWYEKYAIRRYGFHGTSHLYVAHRAAALLDRPLEQLRLVTLHIGNGASAAAVAGGKSIDTSMGFTPLEGLVMGTRCGWIDAAVPLWVMRKEGLDAARLDTILNRESGLLGLTGRFSDRREIVQAAAAGDERCQLALAVECRSLRKVIGAYAALMGGLDAVIFTAGVGENSPEIRAGALRQLDFLGIRLDGERNRQAVGGAHELCISSPGSRVQVWVVPTDEERVIAEDTLAQVTGRFDRAGFRYSFSR
ncbi:MAG: propionate kinase [Deltaproteobacteria bacterium]|nr:MAG: propionate kinase [Deltaproteobacteria bacterium]